MSVEEGIKNSLFSRDVEKTYIDKLLSRKDVEEVKDLIQKDKLTRSELLKLLYMCLGTESKLVNLSSWDRYVILKFFVWIREFIKIAELMYDYKEYLLKKTKICSNCNNIDCKCGNFKPYLVLSDRTKQILEHNERMIEHNAKFLIDLYFNLIRTTLSLGGTGFMELLKNKFEMSYPQQNLPAQGVDQPTKWKLGGNKNG